MTVPKTNSELDYKETKLQICFVVDDVFNMPVKASSHDSETSKIPTIQTYHIPDHFLSSEL